MRFAVATRDVIFFIMALFRAAATSFVLLLALSMWASPASCQTNPAAPHVEVEIRAPDEPGSQSEPDLQASPDASPTPETSSDTSDKGGSEPRAANTVAHPPEIETYVVPEYPQKARAQRIEGKVLLMVTIDEAGKVEDNVKVEDSVPMLDQAAIDAVHRWSFTPARDSFGAPVRVELEVPIRFTLR